MLRHRLHRSLFINEGVRTSRRLRHTAAFWATLGLVVSLNGCSSDDDSDDKPPSKPGAQEGSAGSAGADKTLSNTIKTAAGPVVGEIAHEGDKQILFFRGVPYAAPTGGASRWKPPQPLAPWTSPRDATQWGDRCPQGESTLSSPGSSSEDCLNLNVLTPATKASERLPVMVFFHGGGLSVGTGNSPTYCHTALPAQGVVVVTVNSRLGAFGYYSHPALAKESDKDSSGNYGTLDLIESLKWVQKNIEAFGGDKENVTIFGESGGGSKVLSCMASPLAKGLFHRAIIESGSRSSAPGAVTPRETAEQTGERLAAHLGAEGADALTTLRAKSWEEILEASAAMELKFTANLSIDGWVLPQSVNDAFAQGKQSDVPLIVGANQGEVGEFTSSIPSLAASMKSVSSKAYVYNFSHLPAGWREPGCYAFHGLELVYVFGHLDGVQGDTIVFLGSNASCDPTKDPQIGEADQVVAKNTMRIWTQFAKTGNPSVQGLVDWPAYTTDTDQYLDIGDELKVKSGVSKSGIMPGPAATTTP
jgi:para-nitrobenzyl esterase